MSVLSRLFRSKNSPGGLLSKARAAERSGDNATALNYYNLILNQHPQSSEVKQAKIDVVELKRQPREEEIVPVTVKQVNNAPPKQVSIAAGIITSSQQFADQAVYGVAKWRTSIRDIPAAVKSLQSNLLAAGVPASAIYDLFNNSLLSVCPRCNEYCAGQALLMMDMLGGGHTMFTGNSGGFERMLEGRCLNYSCNSTEHELFWCPDLDRRYLADLDSRGIRIDPNIQRMRDPFWTPQVNKR